MNVNPLLDFSGLPRYKAVRPEHVAPAIDQLLAENRAVIARLADELVGFPPCGVAQRLVARALEDDLATLSTHASEGAVGVDEIERAE